MTVNETPDWPVFDVEVPVEVYEPIARHFTGFSDQVRLKVTDGALDFCIPEEATGNAAAVHATIPKEVCDTFEVEHTGEAVIQPRPQLYKPLTQTDLDATIPITGQETNDGLELTVNGYTSCQANLSETLWTTDSFEWVTYDDLPLLVGLHNSAVVMDGYKVSEWARQIPQTADFVGVQLTQLRGRSMSRRRRSSDTEPEQALVLSVRQEVDDDLQRVSPGELVLTKEQRFTTNRGDELDTVDVSESRSMDRWESVFKPDGDQVDELDPDKRDSLLTVVDAEFVKDAFSNFRKAAIQDAEYHVEFAEEFPIRIFREMDAGKDVDVTAEFRVVIAPTFGWE